MHAKQFQSDAVRLSTVSDSSPQADIANQPLRVVSIDAAHAVIVLRYHEAQNGVTSAGARRLAYLASSARPSTRYRGCRMAAP